MDEKTMNKFYELYLDMLQDSRADAIKNEKYNILVDTLFRNVQLNWDKTGLSIKRDETLSVLLQGLEPRKYAEVYNKLKEMDKTEE